MKKYWIAVLVSGMMLAAGAAAQSGVGTSASGNVSASANGNGANAGASQNAQASSSSASVQANGQAQASEKSGKDREAGNGSAATNGSVAGNGAGAALNSGTRVQAELSKSLDAKKAKAGDEVTAKVTQDVKSNGQIVVRKGSKLIGHVTEAKASSKESSDSRLGIAFDRAVLKDGQEVAFNAVIQALAPGISASGLGDDSGIVTSPMPQPSGGAMPGGGMGGAVGGVGSTVGSATSTAGNTVGSVGSAASGTVNGTVNGAGRAVAGGALSTASRGVIGFQGLNLSSAASGNAQGSVISSPTRNVKLDSGTQMVLQVSGSAQ